MRDFPFAATSLKKMWLPERVSVHGARVLTGRYHYPIDVIVGFVEKAIYMVRASPQLLQPFPLFS